jgi:hypothetical protein
VRIPETLPPREGTAIWHTLAAEMRLAQAMAESSLAGAGLHVSFASEDRADFRTRLQPGPISELMTSASVIAQLQLLKHAAPFFGWSVDYDKVDVLLDEAVDANTRQLPHRCSSLSDGEVTKAIKSQELRLTSPDPSA